MDLRWAMPLAGGTMTLAAAVVGAKVVGLSPVFILVMVMGAMLALDGLMSAGLQVPRRTAMYAVGLGAALTFALLLKDALGGLGPAWAVSVCVMVVLALAAAHTGGGRLAPIAMAVLVVVEGAILVAMMSVRQPKIDVLVFLTDGSHNLLHGVNPYGEGLYRNIYGAHQTALFYGPGVVGSNGHLTLGLPYPPASLLPFVPAAALGDVRFATLVCLLGVALLLALKGSPAQRPAAVLLAVGPGIGQMVLWGWTEGVIVALFALATWLGHRGRWLSAAVVLGLGLSSKQYFVVALPCLWLLRPYATKRRVAAMIGGAAAVTLPFVVWNPVGFWHSIVAFQLMQPLREDSLSLLTWPATVFGLHIPEVLGLLPLAAGFVTALLTARYLRPGTAGFLTAVSLSLLATTMVSKQAFLNYYFLVGALLLLAAWTMAGNSATPDPETETAAAQPHAAGELVPR